MKYIKIFFITHGRIPRSTYIFRMLLLSLTCLGLSSLVGNTQYKDLASVVAALFVYSALILSSQRFHDSGKSGWALWALIIPVIGPLWVVIQLARSGTLGNNCYGESPSAVRAGYLTVDIEE